ncbi:MAG TPA: DUF2203 domain-containing protein [bacterium]|nr:DUF2203 domain-containing protein [bacterium]
MANDDLRIKTLTLEEANALLPQVRLTLKSLRELRAAILRAQAQVEIEEMTQSSAPGVLTQEGHAAVAKWMEVLHFNSKRFEEDLSALEESGAHLKDLDTGLVDFYSLRGRELIFLCWKEGEDEVTHWHSLEGGFRGRQSLDPPVF